MSSNPVIIRSHGDVAATDQPGVPGAIVLMDGSTGFINVSVLCFLQGSPTTTPAAGKIYLFLAGDGNAYLKNSAGSVTQLGAGGGSGGGPITIGSPVVGGSPLMLLYVNGSNKLAQNPSFWSYNGSDSLTTDANILAAAGSDINIGIPGDATSGPDNRVKRIFVKDSVLVGSFDGSPPYGFNNDQLQGLMGAGILSDVSAFLGANALFNGEQLGFLAFAKGIDTTAFPGFFNSNSEADLDVEFGVAHIGLPRTRNIRFEATGRLVMLAAENSNIVWDTDAVGTIGEADLPDGDPSTIGSFRARPQRAFVKQGLWVGDPDNTDSSYNGAPGINVVSNGYEGRIQFWGRDGDNVIGLMGMSPGDLDGEPCMDLWVGSYDNGVTPLSLGSQHSVYRGSNFVMRSGFASQYNQAFGAFEIPYYSQCWGVQNNEGSAISVLLPAPTGTDYVLHNGQRYEVKDENGNAQTYPITVVAPDGYLIDGQASVTITANYGCLRVYWSGENFFTL